MQHVSKGKLLLLICAPLLCARCLSEPLLWRGTHLLLLNPCCVTTQHTMDCSMLQPQHCAPAAEFPQCAMHACLLGSSLRAPRGMQCHRTTATHVRHRVHEPCMRFRPHAQQKSPH
jgi:hypothetical protein